MKRTKKSRKKLKCLQVNKLRKEINKKKNVEFVFNHLSMNRYSRYLIAPLLAIKKKRKNKMQYKSIFSIKSALRNGSKRKLNAHFAETHLRIRYWQCLTNREGLLSYDKTKLNCCPDLHRGYHKTES